MSVEIFAKCSGDEQILFQKTKIILENGDSVQFIKKLPTEGHYLVPFYLSGAKNLPIQIISDFPQFSGTLRENQVRIFERAKEKLLKEGVVMISCFTGFGKTITTLALACMLRLKTLVVTHRVCLVEQWKNSVLEFCSSSKMSELPLEMSSHFNVVNIASISKIKNIKEYELLITDETHLLLSEKRSLNLLRINPKKIIGLTATPYRPDELNTAFKLFFGANYIVEKLSKIHYVYHIQTKIKLENKYLWNKRLDWNFILKQQCENEERNSLIVNIILKFERNRKWLILVKRKMHATCLEFLFKKELFSVCTLIGNETTFDKDANIIIGTFSKIGTGFDHSKLDSLLLASDVVEYFIQFVGRVMRTVIDPIIIDLVDDHPVLVNHFTIRRKVYLDHGGKIKTIDREQFSKE